jgi:hypothetical protein
LKKIILYPKLLAKIMSEKRHNEARVWLTMKMIDEPGKARFTFSELVDLFCSNGEYHLFSAKRLKGLLYSGNGLFWNYLPNSNLIYYYSPGRVAEKLECETVGSSQVIVPSDAVFCSIVRFKSFCHQAFLASTKESPISRNKLEEVIGVSDDTLRSYEKVSFEDGKEVRSKHNYVIVYEGYDRESEQHKELIWQYGYCVKIENEGKVYTAVRKANSYLSPIQLVSEGKTERKIINRHLKLFLGQTGTVVNKVFYHYKSKGYGEGDYLQVTSKLWLDFTKKSKLAVANLWMLAA